MLRNFGRHFYEIMFSIINKSWKIFVKFTEIQNENYYEQSVRSFQEILIKFKDFFENPEQILKKTLKNFLGNYE